MSTVQPITPYEPTTSVLLANSAAPVKPSFATTPVLVATTPTQTVNSFGAVPQLPENVVTALANQQAVKNNSISESEKINYGVISGPAGVTLEQLSAPGQSIKPGAGDFINQLRQRTPGMPFNMTATNVLMTGTNGVGSPENLVRNTEAQLGAVTNSIKNSTTGLTNNGIITGKENSTQVSGVILAASTVGVPTVVQALQNPSTVPSNVGGSSNQLGDAISGGNFAAGMADKISNGAGGVVSSITSITSGAYDTLSSGITSYANKTPGGINQLIGGRTSTMQAAYNLSEKSFGELKANQPNTLGGLPAQQDMQAGTTMTTMRDHEVATQELIAAQKELGQAKKAFAVEESPETYAAMRLAERKVGSAQQQLAVLNKKFANQGQANQSNNSVFGGVSAQTVTALGVAAASGMLNTPNTENTGVNAIPGGLNAFATQIGSAASNVVGSIKNIAGTLAGTAAAAATALANPSKLVGNLTAGVQQTLSNITAGLTQGFNNLANTASTTVSNAQAAFNKISGSAVAGVSALKSGISAAIGGLGNAPGQIKAAVLATNTYANTKAVVTSTLNSALDKKVPAPTFEEVQVKLSPDQQQQAQVQAQATLSELFAKRNMVAYEVDQLVEEFTRTGQPSLIDPIDAARTKLSAIDVEILAAQKNYDRLITA